MSIPVTELEPGTVIAVVTHTSNTTGYRTQTVQRLTATRVITEQNRWVIRGGSIGSSIEGQSGDVWGATETAYLPDSEQADRAHTLAQRDRASKIMLNAMEKVRRNPTDIAALDKAISDLTAFRNALAKD